MSSLKFIACVFLALCCVSAKEKHVLVTGGNGYIGLSTCRVLKEKGFIPVSVDNSSNSKMPSISWGPIEQGDILDKAWLRKIFERYNFVGIIHLAAKIYIPESVEDPLTYYRENIVGSLNVIELAKEFKVKGLVFASTCTVYEALKSDAPVKEDHELNPLSPYSQTKLYIEQLLKALPTNLGISWAILRYFNVSGIDPETDNKDGNSAQLIPTLVKAFAKKPVQVEVMGIDYPTRDGTTVRDYVHVMDVAHANVKALKHVLAENECIILNIGTGTGYTVREVVKAVSQYSGQEYKENCVPRRKGDAARIVADNKLAKETLRWEPQHSSLENIVKSYYKAG
jgi:UDP-glucose 4-epimerase